MVSSRPNARTGLVLLHGASHAADCWELAALALAERDPGRRVVAVDLPGRRGVPGDLGSLTLDACVEAVAEQVDAAGLERFVLAAHSMGGIVVPGLVGRLGGGERVMGMALIASVVPPEGGCVLDTLQGPARAFASRAYRRGGAAPPAPRMLARWLFCNGMSEPERTFVLERLYPDASSLSGQPVRWDEVPTTIPRAWVLTGRDRAVPPAQQRASIERLGGRVELIELDAGHDVMVSHPRKLTEELLKLTERWSAS